MGLLKTIFARARKSKKVLGTLVISVVVLGIVLGVVGCGGSAQSTGPVKATWVSVAAVTNGLSIPVGAVKNNRIVHFSLPSSKNIAYMAYELDGTLYVRSNICPPCRSIGFSLEKDVLVCDTCATRFNARTGDGISGACVAYPKAQVGTEIKDGRIIMQDGDLKTAYENTLKPGKP